MCATRQSRMPAPSPPDVTPPPSSSSQTPCAATSVNLLTTLFARYLLTFVIFHPLTMFGAEPCEFTYKSQYTSSGTFESPDFPHTYSPNTECRYTFDGKSGERVRIEFDKFELQPGTSAGCPYDYIDIFINNNAVRTWLSRYCGLTRPAAIISPYPSVEIIFRTDFTDNFGGFKAVYEFVPETWMPFPNPSYCTQTPHLSGVGGVIRYPNEGESSLPNAQCTWMISAPKDHRVLLYVDEMSMGSSAQCLESATRLSIYDGFESGILPADSQICGKLSFLPEDKKEFMSSSHRLTLKMETGASAQSTSFKIVWTSVWLPDGQGKTPLSTTNANEYSSTDEYCSGHTCKGGYICIDPDGLICNTLPQYCIDRSLQCNGERNCGYYDTSDEEQCYLPLMLAGTFTGLFLIVGLIILLACVRHKRQQRMKLRKNLINLTIRIANQEEMNDIQPQSRGEPVVTTIIEDGELPMALTNHRSSPPTMNHTGNHRRANAVGNHVGQRAPYNGVEPYAPSTPGSDIGSASEFETEPLSPTDRRCYSAMEPHVIVARGSAQAETKVAGAIVVENPRYDPMSSIPHSLDDESIEMPGLDKSQQSRKKQSSYQMIVRTRTNSESSEVNV